MKALFMIHSFRYGIVLVYFLLSVCFPFLMMLEGNYYLHLNFNGLVILNFGFVILGTFVLKPNWSFGKFERGLLLLTALIFANLMIHGIYREEWVNFSYILSITLVSVVIKNIDHSKNSIKLDVYISFCLALSVLIHLLLALIRGYGKLGFTNDCFVNAGQFSSFLMIFSPLFLSICYFQKSETKIEYILKTLCAVACILIFFIVIFNNTRTGWLGAILISSIYHWIWEQKKRANDKISASVKANAVLKIGFVFSLLSISAYLGKQDSAEGRLLIWKLSTTIIRDNPLTGVGFNRFEAVYNMYQSNYFRTHIDPRAAWLADDTLVAYNDFLHFTVELGLFIFLPLFLLFLEAKRMLSIILQKNIKDISVKNTSFIGLLIVVFFQMLFSYPFSIIEVTNAIFLNFLYVTLTDESN